MCKHSGMGWAAHSQRSRARWVLLLQYCCIKLSSVVGWRQGVILYVVGARGMDRIEMD